MQLRTARAVHTHAPAHPRTRTQRTHAQKDTQRTWEKESAPQLLDGFVFGKHASNGLGGVRPKAVVTQAAEKGHTGPMVTRNSQTNGTFTEPSPSLHFNRR